MTSQNNSWLNTKGGSGELRRQEHMNNEQIFSASKSRSSFLVAYETVMNLLKTFKQTLRLFLMIGATLQATCALSSPIEFDANLRLEFVNPALPTSQYEYRHVCAIDPTTGKWSITVDNSGRRIFFDGTNVVEMLTSRKRSKDGAVQIKTNITVHCLYQGVPITMDREHLASWFAYAAKSTIKNNEGKPFPNLHGQYLYDINSHCCVITSEWAGANALAPLKAIFRYSREALDSTLPLLSEEELASDPVGKKALRENYLTLAKENEVYGTFQTRKWIQSHGHELPGSWDYDVSLLNTPSLRFIGQIAGVPRPLGDSAFNALITYDMRNVDSVRDYRFLEETGVDLLSYKAELTKSQTLLPLNDAFFASRLPKKIASTAARHKEAEALQAVSPERRVFFMTFLFLSLGAPIIFFLMRALKKKPAKTST